MQEGDLVQRLSDGALGVTFSISGLEAELLLADGSREIVSVRDLTVVPFKPGSGIEANFVEMVKAYVTLRGFS